MLAQLREPHCDVSIPRVPGPVPADRRAASWSALSSDSGLQHAPVAVTIWGVSQLMKDESFLPFPLPLSALPFK